jgi:hypothetical protein
LTTTKYSTALSTLTRPVGLASFDLKHRMLTFIDHCRQLRKLYEGFNFNGSCTRYA